MPTLTFDLLGLALPPPGAAELLGLLLLPHAASASAPATATTATLRELRKGFSFRGAPRAGTRRIASPYRCMDQTFNALSGLLGIPL